MIIHHGNYSSIIVFCLFVCLFALFACFFHHINIHYSSSSTSRLMGLLELEAVLEEASEEVEEGAYTLLCRNLNDVLDGSTFRFSFCFSFPLSADVVASMVGIISPLSLDI